MHSIFGLIEVEKFGSSGTFIDFVARYRDGIRYQCFQLSAGVTEFSDFARTPGGSKFAFERVVST